jgi:hypothetical protein
MWSSAVAAAAAAAEARFVAEDPATFTPFKADYDRSRKTLTRTGALVLIIDVEL